MTNLWNGLQPLASRPGVYEPDPVRTQRGKAANTAKKERKFDSIPNPWGLTGAECACLLAVTEGHPQTQAAKGLFMSHKTLATHLMRAREKMSAPNTMQTVLLFDRWNRAATQDVEVVLRFTAGQPSVSLNVLPAGGPQA